MNSKPPLSYPAALCALIHCVLRTARLLATGRLRLPAGHVGLRLRFADGSTGRVYRETVAEPGPVREPCVLVVEFRLRGVRGWGVLALVSVPGSIHYIVLPGLYRDDVLARAELLDPAPAAAQPPDAAAWWRLAGVA